MAHEAIQGHALGVAKTQAKLGPPPQHVIGGLRPLLCHQIAYLGGGEIGAEAYTEIGGAGHVLENVADAGAISTDEPPRVVLGQERPRAQRARGQRFEAVIDKVAAGKRAFCRPRPGAWKEVREFDKRIFGKQPVGRDLAAVDG